MTARQIAIGADLRVAPTVLKQLWCLNGDDFVHSHFPLELLQCIFKTATWKDINGATN